MITEPDDSSAPASAGRPSDEIGQAETIAGRPDTGKVPPRPANGAAGQDWVGRSLGKYKVTAFLGQGGMGVVLKGRDPLIERDVAIKVLPGHLAADETALRRFLAEAKAAGKLSHPNVTAIYEIDQQAGTHFIVMEFVPGGSLSERIQASGPCTVVEATLALIDACRAAGAAHAVGLVHRDIKPANFMRTADGSVKVLDFGLAKSAAAGRQETQPGVAVGTPFFMSPEQCEARPVDLRTDIYSLGATYYCLLTGRHPYEDAPSIPQVMYMQCHGPVPDPREANPSIPEACSRIVARAMAKSPDDRYQSTAAMLADLQAVAAVLSGQGAIALPSDSGHRPPPGAAATQFAPPGRRRPIVPILAGVAVLSLVALVLALWQPWRGSWWSGTVPPPAGEPIKVGVLHSFSGPMANSESVVVDATVFAIDEVNQSGGVLGRPVKAVVADGQSDPAVFASEAERLITRDQVCTVFGCWTSASRKTIKPVFEEHDHLLIYPVQYEGMENSPCIIYMGSAPNQQIIPAVRWAIKELKKKRFFLVGSDYVFPRAANEVIKDELKSAGGQVVGEMYLPLGSDRVQPVVDRIVQARPDMILNTINGATNDRFFTALRARGIRPADVPTLSFSVGEPELRGLKLADVAGDYAAWTYFQSLSTPENEEFVRRFREKYPQRPVTDPMEAAYVGVKLWARAVDEADSLEPRQIRRAMLNQRMKAPGGDVRIDPDSQHCYKTPRIGQIQPDGQFRIVWSAGEPVAPEPYPRTRTAADWRALLHDLYTGWGNRWSAPEE